MGGKQGDNVDKTARKVDKLRAVLLVNVWQIFTVQNRGTRLSVNFKISLKYIIL